MIIEFFISMVTKWFKEPKNNDKSWANFGEQTFDWLDRSSNQRAILMRQFLNHNLSKLPPVIAGKIYQGLRNRFHSAFFELILGRILQEVGFSVRYELETKEGKQPDFEINSDLGEIVIEATSPIFNSTIGEFYKVKNPLISIVSKYAPQDWIVNIHRLPEIGFNDSKKYFKKVLKDKFSKIPSSSPPNEIHINHKFKEGSLQLSLFFKSGRKNPIGILPPVSYAENSKKRIVNALDKKKEQLRNIKKPVILAIQGSNTGTELNDFDQVLFGQTFERYSSNRKLIKSGFHASGKLISNNPDPTYQGVLAFHEVGFTNVRTPTLYLHHTADSSLINVFSFFNIKYYDEEKNEIITLTADNTTYLSNLNFISF